MVALAERTAALRTGVDQLTVECARPTNAIGDAEAGADRVLEGGRDRRGRKSTGRATRRSRPASGLLGRRHRDCSAGGSVCGAPGGRSIRGRWLRRRGWPNSPRRCRSAGRGVAPVAEAGPALVAAFVQVRRLRAMPRSAPARQSRASSRRAPAIVGGEPARRWRKWCAKALRISCVGLRRLRPCGEAARGVSDRLTAQMLDLGPERGGARAIFRAGPGRTQREKDSEAFARRVSLLIEFDELGSHRRRQNPVRRDR